MTRRGTANTNTHLRGLGEDFGLYRQRLIWILPVLVLLFGLAISGMLWKFAYDSVDHSAQEYFKFRVHDIMDKTLVRVSVYEQALQGGRGLFESSSPVTREQFSSYVNSLDLNNTYPGILGMGYATVIMPNQLIQHQNQIRAEGFPQYAVKPAGIRPMYTSIIYLEPFDWRNQRAFGYDMFSEPVRRQAMELARDSGQATLSGRVFLVQENGQAVQSGFLIYLPVYQPGHSQDSPIQRQSRLMGWIYAPFRMGDFVQGIYGDRSDENDIQFYDGTTLSPDHLMYELNKGGPASPRFVARRLLRIANHDWTVQVSSLPRMEARFNYYQPVWLGMSGVMISLLIALVLWQEMNGRKRASNLALQLNGELLDSREALQAENEFVSSILQLAGPIILVIDAHGSIISFNRTAEEFTGYTLEEVREPFFWSRFFLPDKREKIEARFRSVLKRNLTENLEESWINRDGEPRLFHWSLSVSTAIPRHTHYLVAIGHDISERRIAENKLIENEQILIKILDLSPISVRIATEGGKKVVFCNQSYLNLIHSRTGLGKDPTAYYQRSEDYEAILDEVRRGKTIINREVNLKTPTGLTVTALASYMSFNYHGENAILGWFYDITDKKEKEQLIWNYANYDSLTNLPNRRLFYDRLAQELKRSDRTRESLALLFVDLDHFKEINDTLGHTKGDMVLIEAARRIRQCIRDTDTLARWGGDEFTVILPSYLSANNIDRICRNILIKLGAVYTLGNGEFGHISASIGVTLYPHDANNLHQLLQYADQAMYSVKSTGRNGFGYFKPLMQEDADKKRQLSEDLREALHTHQLQLHFQPVYDIRLKKIVKAEALLRWYHPEKGLISPSVFIPLAEETGMIKEIGECVCQNAILALQRWQANTGQHLQVIVNRSIVEFDRALTYPWLQQLKDSGLPARSLVLEIKEESLTTKNLAPWEELAQFRKLGIEISVGNFVTGYPTLAQMNPLEVDCLRIDQSFVHDIVHNPIIQALTESLLGIAHRLGISSIAEGIESKEQGRGAARLGMHADAGVLLLSCHSRRPV
ncbi:MAG: EAL domain-containing protein [Ferrovum sp.]|nr:EAL domain-containing protein [Ferrovum sp.]